MIYFKRWWLWGLFFVAVFAGSLFLVNFDLQIQCRGVPNVKAQGYSNFSGPGYGGYYPSDIMFSYDGISQGLRAGVSPHNVMFSPSSVNQMVHPGSIIFPGDIIFPGNIIIGGPKGKTEMRTIMTCIGCSQTMTMATCDWQCGPTFSYCSTGNMYGGSVTGLICSGPTGIICSSGGGSTNIACPTDIICGRGVNTLMTCSTGGIFCPGGGGNTSSTCAVFGCRAPSGNTFITCSSSLYGLCGGPIGGFYGGSIPFEVSTPPPF